MKTLKLSALILAATFIFSSCNTQLNNTAKGGIIGGTGGAGLGALIGGLIGDGKLDKSARKTRSNIKKYDSPDAENYLRVSGLLGPVNITFFDRIRL